MSRTRSDIVGGRQAAGSRMRLLYGHGIECESKMRHSYHLAYRFGSLWDTSPLTMQIPIVVRRKQTKADRPLLGVLHIAAHQIDDIWNLPLLLLGIADRQERLNTPYFCLCHAM